MNNRISRSIQAVSAGVFAVGAAMQVAPALADRNSDAFFGAGYNRCDAKLFALSWGSSDIDAMISEAGDKIVNGYKNQVDDYIEGGRKSNNGNLALCPASEFYSKDDIQAFADFWDYGRREAQDEISMKLLNGEKDAVDWAIKEHKGG